jgi:predicted  nucleic acid-binding Zn-ribbon protein
MTIEEKYLQRAINIRRTYLKMINNMDLYKKRTTEIYNMLEETTQKLNALSKEIEADSKNEKKSINEKDAFEKLLRIIDGVEDEGKRLQKLIDPINQEIEKLAKEESELYRQIVENNPKLTEDQIVKIVQDRLINEGLY